MYFAEVTDGRFEWVWERLNSRSECVRSDRQFIIAYRDKANFGKRKYAKWTGQANSAQKNKFPLER